NYYIMADHLRTTIFALADGATFEPKGRGYILKKLVKKATLLAYLLGLSTEQLIEVSKKLIAVNSSYYQHLKKREDLIINELKKEIVKTREFIDKSIQELGKYYEPSITAKDIFFWYDTKGIPEELIRFFLAKNNYQFPEREFNQLLEKQKERGRQDRAGKKVAPGLEMKSRRVGAEKRRVPKEIDDERGEKIELLNAYNKSGAAYKKKENLYKEAES
ncbi:3567_t:CDS:2, partial [Racocetra persica]